MKRSDDPRPASFWSGRGQDGAVLAPVRVADIVGRRAIHVEVDAEAFRGVAVSESVEEHAVASNLDAPPRPPVRLDPDVAVVGDQVPLARSDAADRDPAAVCVDARRGVAEVRQSGRIGPDGVALNQRGRDRVHHRDAGRPAADHVAGARSRTTDEGVRGPREGDARASFVAEQSRRAGVHADEVALDDRVGRRADRAAQEGEDVARAGFDAADRVPGTADLPTGGYAGAGRVDDSQQPCDFGPDQVSLEDAATEHADPDASDNQISRGGCRAADPEVLSSLEIDSVEGQRRAPDQKSLRPGRVRPDEAALDDEVVVGPALGCDLMPDGNAGHAEEPMDDDAANRHVARVDHEAGKDHPGHAGDLDLKDRVEPQADRARVRRGPRLRVAVDRQRLRDDRQGGGRDDRLQSPSRDVERDRVGGHRAIGIRDRLAQRARARVIRVRDGKRGGMGGEARQQEDPREAEDRVQDHGGASFRSWRGPSRSPHPLSSTNHPRKGQEPLRPVPRRPGKSRPSPAPGRPAPALDPLLSVV